MIESILKFCRSFCGIGKRNWIQIIQQNPRLISYLKNPGKGDFLNKVGESVQVVTMIFFQRYFLLSLKYFLNGKKYR